MSRATLVLALIALALLAAAVGPPLALAQTGPDAPPAAAPAPAAPEASPAPAGDSAGSSGPSIPNLLDLLMPFVKQIAEFLFDFVTVGLLQGIYTLLHAVVDAFLGSAFNVVTQTPPGASYGSATVQTLSGTVRAAANAALVLIAVWGAFNLMVREHIGASYHDAMELLPRLVLGAVLVNTSGWWTQLAIDANNALCNAVGHTGLPAYEAAGTATKVVIDLVSRDIYLVVGLLLVLQQLMRLALVDVLLVVAPLALLCWVLPQTQGYARLWSTTFVGTVFTQFVQVVALKVGASLITDIQPAALDAMVVTRFLGVAVMLLTLKIPDLMRGQLGDGLGFARFYAYRSGARTLEGASSGGASSGGGATARAAASAAGVRR